MAEPFAEQLRQHRAAAELSIGALAKRVNYSKGYLSRVERGLRAPNETLAKLCDAALGAGGELIAAARADRDQRAETLALDRRQVLTAGTVLGLALMGGPRPALDDRVIDGMRTSFEHLRVLGAQASPVMVLEPLVAHVRTVHALAAENPEPTRASLLLLAGRMAEYTGWMYQESGDDQSALWWTRHAAELARAGGDQEIASYALVREAGLALYRHDPIRTIDLARQAQHIGTPSRRTLAMAARREAQGHALAGDLGAYERASDRAAALIQAATADDRAYPVLGTTAPEPVELARGWSLCDLGRAAESAAVLDRAMVLVPAASRRSRARFGVRRSLAHALSGEVDQSCVTLFEVLDDAAHVDSATVRMDLREVARTLSRWRNHRAVREVYPDLSRVLHQV
ncbi:helix-turn-helix transcriptional regulator [Actinokineospora diospyrosa]|uniref:Helix-turn-helix domain-containing protein n=1 Tax=Actinokineospora diospyrosa TaxID=103728 RepID=A0ABT1I5T8_9PSEU|nr:helix-turn-helix transcriptional regulator [Actinokineospora diospyrosa]MCP2267988.1 Helix-turn-helix domain-containing protein [Actinokineospora diospyrosa]